MELQQGESFIAKAVKNRLKSESLDELVNLTCGLQYLKVYQASNPGGIGELVLFVGEKVVFEIKLCHHRSRHDGRTSKKAKFFAWILCT